MPSSLHTTGSNPKTSRTSRIHHKRTSKSISPLTSIWLSFLLVILTFSHLSSATIYFSYCSKENTALGEYDAYVYDYQSDGECYNHCQENYAFAILLYKQCWCSNYAPETSVDLMECAVGCPGFPADRCGNESAKLYQYLEMPQHLPSSRSKDAPVTTTVREPNLTVQVPVEVPVTITREPSKSSPTRGSTSNQMVTTSDTPTPIIQITTILGSQKTITVTPTASSTATSTNVSQVDPKKTDFFSNTGSVAAVFTVLAIVVIALIGAIYWFFRTRRNRRDSTSSPPSPEMGMSGNNTPPIAGTGASSPRPRARSTSTLGFAGSLNQEKGGPSTTVTPAGYGESERIVDQRLDPGQIFLRFQNDNGSRASLRSLQDNHDYSRRVLKVTNGDD